MTPEERARRSADAMWSTDRASKWFGMELGEVGPGAARMTLTVAEDQCNGHGICHGGVIFSLADSAFAFACNSRNAVTVAQVNQIQFIAPAKAGDRLVAEAREVNLRGRTGVYDVTVTGPDGVVAEMRGTSRSVAGRIFEEDA